MPVDRSRIRVKAMLVALSDDRSAHAVSLNPPTAVDDVDDVDEQLPLFPDGVAAWVRRAAAVPAS